MKKVLFTVEKTKTGFAAYAVDDAIPVGTTGKSMSDLRSNILDALNTYREHKGEKIATSADVILQLDLQQFFEYYNVLNAKGLSVRIGMNETLLSQYVNGQKHPSEKQVQKILQGVKDLGKELTQLELV
ncbi:hypothetical protein [Chitinophaga defluvii]|uniref:XRE family transcriptional regulator n=1 Tax=Chitinophaga defluvii TaxID=3163343 RepID=A0ABV2TA35_9BACT